VSLLERLKRRKLFQWALAYVAAGWLAAQVLDVFAEPWGLSGGLERTAQALLALGFPVVLVLAWYHGEKGRQRVSGPEFVILTSLVLLAGTALAVFNPMAELPVDPASVVASRDLGPNSIVVLPFEDMSFDGDQEYMSDGIAEELLTMLMTIPEMTVISRTTAFSFKDAGLTVREIADELGVAHVLEGSVRKAGNTIRITAQLIDPRTDAQLFSETFDRALEDIFAIQEEIAARVVSGLRLIILGELPTLQQTDPEVYALFLQAIYVKNTGDKGRENRETEVAMLERVRELAPDYAPVYGPLAAAYAQQVSDGFRPPEEGLQMARDAAERGLALDPDLVTAQSALVFASLVEQDFEGARRHIERAMEMDPDDPYVLTQAGLMLLNVTRFDEAISVFEYTIDRDPVNQADLRNVALAYALSGQWDKALSTRRTLLNLNPSLVDGHFETAMALLHLGEFEEALAEAELMPDDPFGPNFIRALASHSLGRQPEFESAFQEVRDLVGDEWPLAFARVYAYTGDIDAAFEWLDREPEPDRSIYFDPLLVNLHDDPRWAAWFEQMDPSIEELRAIPFDVRVPR
jgi:adenylate cyclase